MSANGDEEDGDSGPGTREVAYRLFAAEFDDCDFQFSESDEERAPNYVITPTGGRVNRLFLTGVLTELEQVNETMLRARIVDPTGAFVVYAGQYQPEALSFLERAEPPAFLAVTGKARTYQPDDSEVVYSSVRPESISEVDAETRDRWVVSTAEQTLDRIGVMAAAIDTGLSGGALREELESEGVDAALAQGVALARDHYGTTPAYLDALRDLALDATRVVANERDEAGKLDLAPDEGGPADIDALRAGGPQLEAAAGSGSATAEEVEPTGTTTAAGSSTTAESGSTAESEVSTTATTGTEARAESDTAAPAESDPSESTESAAEPPVEGEPTTASEPSSSADEPATQGTTDTGSTAEPSVGADDGDDLGEFEPGEFDEEPEEDPLGDDVREQVEEEYGTEFSTGTEVESEPDLEPEAEPEPTDEADPAADVEPETEPEPATESEATDEPEESADESSEAEEPADEPAEDVDLSEAVMDAMRDLDEGDGAPTDAVIDRVVDRTGAGPDEVDEAVQDALMGGQCYEPEDGKLKPI
jgi:RPA family protein